MALSSSFQERLQQLEQTRIHRLSLLQAEKELQASKSQVLSSKIASIRSMERRCLLLEQKTASQNLKISFLKSEIESRDEKSRQNLIQLRVLKEEVEELENTEKERKEFYGAKKAEMDGFRRNVEKFFVESRVQVEELRHQINELKSSITELQGKSGYLSNPEIAAAEKRKSELLSLKENLDREIASNHQIKAQLQKQLQNMLIDQNQERRKASQLAENKGTDRATSS